MSDAAATDGAACAPIQCPAVVGECLWDGPPRQPGRYQSSPSADWIWLLFFTVVRNTVPDPPGRPGEGENMSVYRVTEVIGTSTESWEHAARSAVETAAATVREIRVAEVTRQDVTIENGQVSGYRVRLAISFKYESDR